MLKASNNTSSGFLSNASRHMAGLVAVLFWGFSFVSTSVLMDQGGLSPTEAYVYRFFLAYLIMVGICHKKWFCNNAKDEALMLLCGMSSGSLYFIAENTALTMTYTTNVSLLSSTSPLVTILLVGLLYKSERPGKGIIIGSMIAFVGVVCVVMNTFFSSSNNGTIHINPLGDLLAISTAFLWGIYSIILRRLNVVYSSLFITRKTFFYGLVTALPFLLMEPTLVNPLKILSQPIVLGNLLFLVLGASTLSFYLWTCAVDALGAVKANNYMYLQPVVTLVASAILLHEPIYVLGILGMCLVLFGLWFGDYLQGKLMKRH